jgi:hypothetical protein
MLSSTARDESKYWVVVFFKFSFSLPPGCALAFLPDQSAQSLRAQRRPTW